MRWKIHTTSPSAILSAFLSEAANNQEWVRNQIHMMEKKFLRAHVAVLIRNVLCLRLSLRCGLYLVAHWH